MLAFLGLSDPWIIAAYVGCLASAALCLVYGLLAWNKGAEPTRPADQQWAEHEDEIAEEL